jgi:methylated-DNA-[protein]-cysteine S-methyltransferase
MEVLSPVGPLGVAVDGAGIVAVRFAGPPAPARAPGLVRASGSPPATCPATGAPLLDLARQQLDEYFAGGRTGFTLPLTEPVGSDFERAVWARIAAIPYGETATYGTIAARVGEPDAARAVGVACNRNPVPIVVPCHRVVGAGGKLVGFGGGLRRKRFLLELEARVWIEREFSS